MSRIVSCLESALLHEECIFDQKHYYLHCRNASGRFDHFRRYERSILFQRTQVKQTRCVFEQTPVIDPERPTDLTFIDPGKIAVAFLARTIHLRGDEVVTRPRL